MSLYGAGDALRVQGANGIKQMALSRLEQMSSMLAKTVVFNKPCMELLFALKTESMQRAFIYADPPYLATSNRYSCGHWTKKDTEELFGFAKTKKHVKIAISEFNNPEIIKLAKAFGLTVILLRERFNIKNRATEVLITNYEINGKLFD